MQPTQASLFNPQHGLTHLQAESALRLQQALATVAQNTQLRDWRKANPLMGAPGYTYASGFGHGYLLALEQLRRVQTPG